MNMHRLIQQIRLSRLAALAGIGLLAACGGGGGGGTTITPPAGGGTDGTGAVLFASGVMTKGSVIVNGVRFDDSTATITFDDRPGTAAQLQSGLRVKVRGKVNSDNVTGTAERVQVENEVRGFVSAINAAARPQSLVVGGLSIVVDDSTIYANLSGFAALTVGAYLEIYGVRDAAGIVRASRVEAKTRDITLGDDLRGIVSGLDTVNQRFQLGAVLVRYSGTAFSPAGTLPAALVNGIEVEVHGSFSTAGTEFTATRVDIEDLEDAAFKPGVNDRNEIEGFVSNLNTAAGSFTVAGQQVTYTTSTEFRGGSVNDLANNVRVEVDGSFNGASLVAREIRFKQVRVILTGFPSAVDAAQRTVTLFGKTVFITDLTDVRTPLASLNTTTRIEVRAAADSAGVLSAERIENIGNSGGGRDIVQAVATAKGDAATPTVTLLGFTANLSGASFTDRSGAAVNLTAFLAAITPNATVVKVKGTFASASLINAVEAEIED